MAQTTFKKIRIGDRFGTTSGKLGTVQSLVWIEDPLRQRVEVQTEYGREQHPVNETVFLLHEAKKRTR